MKKIVIFLQKDKKAMEYKKHIKKYVSENSSRQYLELLNTMLTDLKEDCIIDIITDDYYIYQGVNPNGSLLESWEYRYFRGTPDLDIWVKIWKKLKKHRFNCLFNKDKKKG